MAETELSRMLHKDAEISQTVYTMANEFKIVILATFDRNNFPNKAMVDIHGKPMIERVYDSARSSGASEIVIATSSPRVGMVAEDFGATVCMVVDEALRGIAHLSEVVDKMGWSDDEIVVNFPGDAPLTPGSIIRQVADNLHMHTDADCTTLYSPVSASTAGKRGCITMTTDSSDYVMYMSRQPIPHQSSESFTVPAYKCYLGLNAFRVGLLRIYCNLRQSEMEQAEEIEELRLLYNGLKIHAAEANSLIGQRVLTEEDVEKVRIQIAPSR